MFRPRRLRKNSIIRAMRAETRLSLNQLIYPFFVTKGTQVKHPIGAMPNVYHWSLDLLVKEVEACIALGIRSFLLFGVNEPKSPDGVHSFSDKSIVAEAVRLLKSTFGDDIYIITDVCVCAYTSHGHCGILDGGNVSNDISVELLAKMALAHAQAGADMVAPSDMMDGRIAAMRTLLDAHQMTDTAIMSYSTKFASAYYGPFREAADSSPQKGDRQGYQMDIRNGREALMESLLDEGEGADVLMVKPALAYLDVIADIRANTLLPIACYNVSGEYSMVKYAAEKGLVDERKMVMENMYAFTRAGADWIISYHAKDIAAGKWI